MVDLATNPRARADRPECWPELPIAAWRDTCATLHLWTQIVGKLRLALTPLVNHWWNVPLYVNARGLTTSAMPYGERSVEVQFDFLAQELVLMTCDGQRRTQPLQPQSVAVFYQRFLALLADADIAIRLWGVPSEVPDPIPFDRDTFHAAYDGEAARRFWTVLRSATAALEEFRAGFVGKCSPVHFFWGTFDLAVTRFSGLRAPERPGADRITHEAYSHEVSSVGFWPGDERGGGQDAAFYCYAAPEPPGFRQARVRPAAAYYDAALGEFLLPYEAVRRAASPTASLLAFCQSAYDAAADLGHWDRAALERRPPERQAQPA